MNKRTDCRQFNITRLPTPTVKTLDKFKFETTPADVRKLGESNKPINSELSKQSLTEEYKNGYPNQAVRTSSSHSQDQPKEASQHPLRDVIPESLQFYVWIRTIWRKNLLIYYQFGPSVNFIPADLET